MAAIQRLASDATRTVEGTLEAYCDTWNLHDMNAMAALYCADADFVNVIGMRFQGSSEIMAAHRLLHQDRFAHTKVKQLQYSINYLNQDTALAHVRWEMTGDPAAANKVRRGTMTHILVRKHGEWLFRATQNTDIVDVPDMVGHPFWSKYL